MPLKLVPTLLLFELFPSPTLSVGSLPPPSSLLREFFHRCVAANALSPNSTLFSQNYHLQSQANSSRRLYSVASVATMPHQVRQMRTSARFA